MGMFEYELAYYILNNMQYTVCYLILKNKLYIKQNTICFHKSFKWLYSFGLKNPWNWNQTFLYFNKKKKKIEIIQRYISIWHMEEWSIVLDL